MTQYDKTNDTNPPTGQVNAAVVLQFVLGKNPKEACEDVIVSHPESNWWAVIDGATGKTSHRLPWEGELLTTGRYAALVVAETIKKLPPNLSPRDFTNIVSDRLKYELSQHSMPQGVAACSLAATNGKDVIVLGDCLVGVESASGVQEWTNPKLIDQINSQKRADILIPLLEKNLVSPGTDPGRDAILPLLRTQHEHANRAGDPLGYPVVDGSHIPTSMIVHHCLDKTVSRVVLASDGYPQLVHNNVLDWSTAERYIDKALQDDPYCVAELRSTKGLVQGLVSFDDRAWLEIAFF